MAVTVFSTVQTQRMRDRMPERLAHRSSAASPYSVERKDALGHRQTPSRRDGLPGNSFSAQLLELGLKHHVDGLIQRAQEPWSIHGETSRSAQCSAQYHAARHYERAQDNFVSSNVSMIERQY